MTQAHNQHEHEEEVYEFDEDDIRVPGQGSGTPDHDTNKGESVDDLGLEGPRHKRTDEDEAEPVTPGRRATSKSAPAPKAKKAKKASGKGQYLVYAGLGLAVLTCIGGFSYWAIQMANPDAANTDRQRQSQPTLQMQGSPVTEPPALSPSPSRKVIGAGPATSAQAEEVTQAPAFQPHVEPNQPGEVAGSDEEYYDRMAIEAGKETSSIPVIPEPVPAPRAADVKVIDTKVASADQLASVNADVRKNSEDMAELLGAVKQVQSVIGDLKKQIDLNSAKTNDLGTQVSSLATQVGTFSKTYDAKLSSISKEAVTASLAAVASKEHGGGKESGKLVLAGGPLVSQSVPRSRSKREADAPAAETPRLDMPEAKPLPAPVIAQSSNPSGQCAGKAVSQIWHVKGVGPMAAFIRRDSDNIGFLVKLDEEVPGFGTVKSFDPNARTVCTSNGLIVR